MAPKCYHGRTPLTSYPTCQTEVTELGPSSATFTLRLPSGPRFFVLYSAIRREREPTTRQPREMTDGEGPMGPQSESRTRQFTLTGLERPEWSALGDHIFDRCSHLFREVLSRLHSLNISQSVGRRFPLVWYSLRAP